MTGMTRSFLADDDLSPAEQAAVLELAANLKRAPYDCEAAGRTAQRRDDLRQADAADPGLLRRGHRRARRPRRCSSTARLAGIGKRESVADVARVLGRQAAVIVWRTYGQDAIEEMAEYSGVPVVNALTDEYHPCQLLADLLTVKEHKGTLAGLTVAFVGDGACNMGNSWLLAGATAGMHVRISAPEGTEPRAGDGRPRQRDRRDAPAAPRCSSSDPVKAVDGADVVVTDTWVSMGKESEAERAAGDVRRLHRHRRADVATRRRTRS